MLETLILNMREYYTLPGNAFHRRMKHARNTAVYSYRKPFPIGTL
jgi:hypothetical protein